MNFKREYILLGILVIIHLVGIFGLINSDFHLQILSLTPYNLVLTCGILLWANDDFNLRMASCMLLIFFIVLLIEILGVNTGYLFGIYAYGAPLGFKVGGVPLVIGINWILISLGARSLCELFLTKKIMKMLIASVVMTGMDVLIEPVAVKLDFWHWKDAIIPFQNYAMWFITSLAVQWIITKSQIKLNAMAGTFVLFIQFMFFFILYLLLILWA